MAVGNFVYCYVCVSVMSIYGLKPENTNYAF